jgi:hypothetical protein
MLKLRFQIGNLLTVPARLSKLAQLLDNWGEFLQSRFLPEYLRDVNRNFDTEGGLVGGWAALSPAYAAWKRRTYPGRRILERSLKLRQSLAVNDASNAGMSLVVSKRQMFIGTDISYAGRQNARRRFMLGPKDLDKQKYSQLMADWAQGLIKDSDLG